MVYDPRSSKLLMFGGWSNQWRSDVQMIDVGDVVGPPYAVTAIIPNRGPVTGGIVISLEGLDFVNQGPVVVRFAIADCIRDVEGEFVNDGLIKCIAPDFTEFGAIEVIVRVSLRGDSFTTSFQKFQFFAVTDSKKCVAFGPGLLSNSSACILNCFTITAVDTEGDMRTSGGDEFDVTILDKDGLGIHPKIKDNKDGTYMVTYKASQGGKYSIEVEFKGTHGGAGGPLRGSPFEVALLDKINKANNSMTGPLLIQHTKFKIQRLKAFTAATLEGLQQEIERNNLDQLLVVKEHLQNIKLKGDEVQLTLDVAVATLNFLQKFPVEGKEQMQEDVNVSKQMWDEAKRLVGPTRARIAPMVKTQSIVLKVALAEYEEKCNEYHASLRKADFWHYKVGPDDALEVIRKCLEAHEEKEAEYDTWHHKASVFEFPAVMAESRAILDKTKQEMEDAEKLWLLIERFEMYRSMSRQMVWADTNIDAMEIEAHTFNGEVRGFPETVRWCDAYQTLDAVVRDFAKACPLATALKSPNMRPRHWKALSVSLKKSFPMPHETPDMKVGVILSLQLHKHTEQVEEVVEQASKESKMEMMLETLRETWSKVEFHLEPYNKTSLQLLKMDQKDFEQLENDQMLVQGMLLSRYVAFFQDSVEEWKERLDRTFDVVVELGEIMQSWAYVEPLFMGSTEVRRELPVDCNRFRQLDKETREIIQEGDSIKNVKEVCNQPGLLEQLNSIHSRLLMCKKALVDFLDGKRRKFPRFYFLSEVDLLDILSKGTEPAKIIHHASKLFLATRSIDLEPAIADGALALRWHSAVGGETVHFSTPVELQGKVERYLLSLLAAMQSTLQEQVTGS